MKQIATGIVALFLGAALFFGISFWMSYVTLDIVKLYKIPYLINFDFYQIFGSIIVLAIVRMKTNNQKNDKDSEVEDKFTQSIAQTISGGLNILLIWGLCYAAKYLFS
jgi:nucleoside permease NupC